jgi:hypothetical protein
MRLPRERIYSAEQGESFREGFSLDCPRGNPEVNRVSGQQPKLKFERA